MAISFGTRNLSMIKLRYLYLKATKIYLNSWHHWAITDTLIYSNTIYNELIFYKKLRKGISYLAFVNWNFLAGSLTGKSLTGKWILMKDGIPSYKIKALL